MALATNWRYPNTDGIFISSRDGDDINAGTKALPKRTIYSTSDNLRVRAGYYTIPATITGYSDIIGDGQVVIDGMGFSPNFGTSNVADFTFSGLQMKSIILNNGITLAGGGTIIYEYLDLDNTRLRGRCNRVEYCILRNGSLIRQDLTANKTSIRCTIVEASTLSFSTGAGMGILRNSFIESGSTLTGATSGNQIFDSAFEVGTLIEGVDITAQTLDGDGDTIANTYASNELFSGTITLSGKLYTFTDCFYTTDPKFNDSANGDYTLKSDSPLINGGKIAGTYSTATRFDALHPAFDIANGAVISPNITLVGNEFQLTSGNEGRVVSSPSLATSLELPYFSYINEIIQFFGAFNYNNGDWIDEENYNAGINDEVRLTFRIRPWDFSNNQWGTWYDIETFTKLEVDTSDRGNGDVDVDFVNSRVIGGKNFQVDFVIRNNGV